MKNNTPPKLLDEFAIVIVSDSIDVIEATPIVVDNNLSEKIATEYARKYPDKIVAIYKGTLQLKRVLTQRIYIEDIDIDKL